MLPEELRASLKSPRQADFMVALRRLVGLLQADPNFAGALHASLEAVTESGLPAAQQSRRATLIIQRATGAVTFDPAVVRCLSDLAAPIRNGVAAGLPPEARFALYNRGGDATETALPLTGDASDCSVLDESPRLGLPISEHPSTAPLDDTPDDRRTVVVLLSKAENQEANYSLLRGDGFGAYRVNSRADLNHYLGSLDVCGFVVDGSFWMGLTADEQDEVIRAISVYSSFTCVLIDKTNFHDPAIIRELISRTRPDDPEWYHWLLRSNSAVADTDLDCFRAGSDLLAIQRTPAFVPASLTDAERTAVVATANAFFRAEYKHSAEALASLAFSPIPTGRSMAKTILLRFNNQGIPVVVKVDNPENTRDEALRFNRYIRRWDQVLRPYFQFHRGVGVIVFSLVEDESKPFSPAPSLDDQLHQALGQEVYSTDQSQVKGVCDSIARVIDRTCTKVASLNMRPAGADPMPSQAWLRGSGLRELTVRGVQWDIPELDGQPIGDLLDRAYAITAHFDLAATVHGDLHLQNVLVPRDGTPYLIDYAYSGPGHPAYDLLRLETALFFRYLRPLGRDDEFAALQEAFSVALSDERELRERFPIWWTSEVNVALLQGALRCRSEALRVLEEYGAGPLDYVACKFVLCCWSLILPTLQQGLVRATLGGLVGALRSAPTD